jgi:hypothetical protein
MVNPIARPGTRHVADIPNGAATIASMYEGSPCWIVAPVNEPPYWLFCDGTKKLIEPVWEDDNA